MYGKTLIGLIALAATVGGLLLWQNQRESSGTFGAEEPLFEDVRLPRLRSIRFDHLERSANLKLERDAAGLWYITDPIAYPAEESVLRLLLEIIVKNRATPVPPGSGTAADFGLDPPRAVFEIIEERDPGVGASGPEGTGQAGAVSAGSTERRQRVELGRVDIDGDRIYVRTRGRIYRTSRNLDNTLLNELSSFRRRRLLSLDHHRVVQISRSGTVRLQPGQDEYRLDFTAFREGDVWRATDPGIRADPRATELLVQAAVYLRADAFEEDEAEDFSRYGLDPPSLTVSLVDTRGNENIIELGRVGSSNAYARIKGQPNVFGIELSAFMRLCFPTEALFDTQVVRQNFEGVERMLLWRAGEELRFERDPGRRVEWVLSRFVAENPEPEESIRADRGRVEDLFRFLEALRIEDFRRSVRFKPAEGGVAFQVEGVSKEGGRLGQLDGERISFERLGDNPIGYAPLELLERLQAPFDHWRNRLLVSLKEIDQRRLEVTGQGASRAFVRDRRGLWIQEGAQGNAGEASEIFFLLDVLHNLRAERHLGEGTAEALDESVAVTLTSLDGVELTFHIGLLGPGSGTAGGACAVVAGRLALLENPGLHAGLLELLSLR